MVYNVTEEKNVSGAISSSNRKWEISISRAGSKTVAIAAKPIDSNMPPKEILRNADLSVVQNINGKNTIIGHPYDFPIKPGKTWKVEYVTEGPDARTKSEKITKNYSVLGWVDVKVPAGTFHALKVEMEGEWTKEFNESVLNNPFQSAARQRNFSPADRWPLALDIEKLSNQT